MTRCSRGPGTEAPPAREMAEQGSRHCLGQRFGEDVVHCVVVGAPAGQIAAFGRELDNHMRQVMIGSPLLEGFPPQHATCHAAPDGPRRISPAGSR